MKRLAFIISTVAGVVILLLPWWRNHALLQDFYDYGLVMAAAGRIELGERPYVDFITPIQTLQFLAAVLAEWLWGARYLSLTYLNAVFIALSFVGLAALLRKNLGPVVALLAAAAIVMASSVQHTIIWYNAMGVTWLALVVWLSPRLSSERRAWSVNLAVVCAVLWVCGMTKLTYQISALAFATTFTLRGACLKTITWPIARLRLLAFVVFGIIAPVATELVFTGARLEQWLENVVVLPARFRTDMLGHIMRLGSYFHTPHDYYKPIHFTYAGAWGVALLLVVTAILIAQNRAEVNHRRLRLAFLGSLVIGAWICGAVLLVTNMDIAYLSGAAWLVFAIGLTETGRFTKSGRATPAVRLTLAVAAVSLLIPATTAAWRGTRALWGHAPLVRSELVTTDDLPPRFSYLKGMKVFPTFHDSIVAYARKQDALAADGVPLTELLFVNGTEWMVRAMPEARHRGFPLWFAGGTTYSESDAWEMGDRLEHDPTIRIVVSYAGWTYWYEGLRKCFDRAYRKEDIGPRFHVYTRRQPPEPVELAINTQSNVYAGEMTVHGGPLALHVAKNGLFFFGGPTSHRIDLASPIYRLKGEMVGELPSREDGRTIEVVFRVRARVGNALTDTLWEEKVQIGSGERWFSRTFAVSTGGRPVSLLVEVPPDTPGSVGWRNLQIDHSGALGVGDPWPMDRRLPSQPIGPEEERSLFGSGGQPIAMVKEFGSGIRSHVSSVGPELLTTGANELWFKVERPSSRVSGEFGLQSGAWTKGGARVAVICYKSGRFDVLYRKDFTPQTEPTNRDAQHFEIGLPEGVAWVGFVVIPLEAGRRDAGDAWWRNVRIW